MSNEKRDPLPGLSFLFNRHVDIARCPGFGSTVADAMIEPISVPSF